MGNNGNIMITFLVLPIIFSISIVSHFRWIFFLKATIPNLHHSFSQRNLPSLHVYCSSDLLEHFFYITSIYLSNINKHYSSTVDFMKSREHPPGYNSLLYPDYRIFFPSRCMVGYVNASLSVFLVSDFENRSEPTSNGSEFSGSPLKYCR